MTTQEEYDIIRANVIKMEEENFGVCPSGPFMDRLLERMWELENKLKNEEKK